MTARMPTYQEVRRVARVARRQSRSIITQTVADAADRAYQARWRSVVELVAQVADVDLDDVVVARVVVSPDAVEDGALGEDPARLLEQHHQEVELARSQVDRPAAAADLAGLGVQLEVGEPQRPPDLDRAPSQDRAHPRDQLLEMERLDQAGVGPRLEA